jgi:hypothetical protein
MDFELAAQTQSMAYGKWKPAGSMSFYWMPNSPVISTTSVNSDVTFTHQNTDMEIGWLCHPNTVEIRCSLYVGVVARDLPLLLTMETGTLVTAVATATSARMGAWNLRNMAHGPWTHDLIRGLNEHMGLGLINLALRPTIPADNLVAIKFKGYWDATADPLPAARNRIARLMAARIYNVVAPPDPES